MNKFTEVTENFYKDFLRWGRDNIEGFHYEVIMIVDRTVIKNKEGEVLAYRDLAYAKTYHIKQDVIDRLINEGVKK